MLQAEPGYYVDTPASTSQTPCSAGTFNPNSQADDMSDCTPADTGHYVALQGSIRSKTHAFGSYSSMQGQIACDAASRYYVPNSAADEQLPCSVGTWQSSQGSTGCDTADPGHYVDSQAASMQTACLLELTIRILAQ